MQTPKPPKATIRSVHKYIGLTAGLIILFQALTGTVIAFHSQLDKWLAEDLYTATEGTPLPPAELLESTRDWDYPESTLTYMSLNGGAGEAWNFYLNSADLRFPLEVFVDPSTGEIVGDRVVGQFCWQWKCFKPFVFQLHVDLTVGEPGRWIMGTVAVAWLGTTVLGILLTTPRGSVGWLRRWRPAWRFPARPGQGPARRVLSGAHRALGLWTLVLALILCVTGFALALNNQVAKPAVSLFSPVTESSLHHRYVGSDFQWQVPLPLALEVAQSAAEGYAKEHGIEVSLNGVGFEVQHGGYDVDFSTSESVIPNFGYIVVSVDAASGAVMDVRNETGETAGDAVIAWMYPIHSGLVVGLAGQILVFITGLALLTLGGMGLALWWNRRRKQAAKRKEVARGTASARPSEI